MMKINPIKKATLRAYGAEILLALLVTYITFKSLQVETIKQMIGTITYEAIVFVPGIFISIFAAVYYYFHKDSSKHSVIYLTFKGYLAPILNMYTFTITISICWAIVFTIGKFLQHQILTSIEVFTTIYLTILLLTSFKNIPVILDLKVKIETEIKKHSSKTDA